MNQNQTIMMTNKCCNLSISGESETRDNQIKEQAYYLWEAAGKPECDGTQFWLEAEKLINEKA